MNIKFDFSGKIVLITGAAAGIGKRTALRFAEAGASALIVDFNAETGEKTSEECRSLGVKSAFYRVDIADENAVFEMGKRVLADFGHIDFLVSNAGIIGAERGNPFTNITAADMRRVLDINTIGLVNIVQAFYENFTSRKQGKIVATASVASFKPTVKMPQYAASKAAVFSLVKSLAVEFGNYNVNVNAIAPGYVYTSIYHDAIKYKKMQPGDFDDCETSEDVVNKLGAKSALHRVQTEDDMANAIMILCAEETRNMTAQCLIVDSGGLLVY